MSLPIDNGAVPFKGSAVIATARRETPPMTEEFFRYVEWQADLSGLELAIYLGEHGWTYDVANVVAPEAICARVMPSDVRRVA